MNSWHQLFRVPRRRKQPEAYVCQDPWEKYGKDREFTLSIYLSICLSVYLSTTVTRLWKHHRADDSVIIAFAENGVFPAFHPLAFPTSFLRSAAQIQQERKLMGNNTVFSKGFSSFLCQWADLTFCWQPSEHFTILYIAGNTLGLAASSLMNGLTES